MNERESILYELHLAALAAQNVLDHLAKICDTTRSDVNVKTQAAYDKAQQLASSIQATQSITRWMNG